MLRLGELHFGSSKQEAEPFWGITSGILHPRHLQCFKRIICVWTNPDYGEPDRYHSRPTIFRPRDAGLVMNCSTTRRKVTTRCQGRWRCRKAHLYPAAKVLSLCYLDTASILGRKSRVIDNQNLARWICTLSRCPLISFFRGAV